MSKGIRFWCQDCGTVVTATRRKAAMRWPCKCGSQNYGGYVDVPVIEIDPEHEALVDKLVAERLKS